MAAVNLSEGHSIQWNSLLHKVFFYRQAFVVYSHCSLSLYLPISSISLSGLRAGVAASLASLISLWLNLRSSL